MHKTHLTYHNVKYNLLGSYFSTNFNSYIHEITQVVEYDAQKGKNRLYVLASWLLATIRKRVWNNMLDFSKLIYSGQTYFRYTNNVNTCACKYMRVKNQLSQ